jgi:hypothetical protein
MEMSRGKPRKSPHFFTSSLRGRDLKNALLMQTANTHASRKPENHVPANRRIARRGNATTIT